MQYVLFNVPNLGFVEQTMEAMVDGIAESVRRAHEALQPGSIFIRYRVPTEILELGEGQETLEQ